MMSYKGYTAKIEYDDEAGLFHGQVVDLRDVITFQGQSVEELRQEFAASVEDYLEFCAERGVSPEKPFSGQFIVRTTPVLHRAIAIAASRANQSINAWVTAILQRSIMGDALTPSSISMHASVTHNTFMLRAVVHPEGGDIIGDVMPRLKSPITQTVSKQISSLTDNAAYISELGLVLEEED